MASAAAAKRDGGRIYNETHADEIEGGKRRARRDESRRRSRPHAVVVATNTPVNDLVAIHTKQAPYRTFVVGARVPRGSVPQILLWDTPDPVPLRPRPAHGRDG